jgi:ribosomal protein S14
MAAIVGVVPVQGQRCHRGYRPEAVRRTLHLLVADDHPVAAALSRLVEVATAVPVQGQRCHRGYRPEAVRRTLHLLVADDHPVAAALSRLEVVLLSRPDIPVLQLLAARMMVPGLWWIHPAVILHAFLLAAAHPSGHPVGSVYHQAG